MITEKQRYGGTGIKSKRYADESVNDCFSFLYSITKEVDR
jgi:hypothetical protein